MRYGVKQLGDAAFFCLCIIGCCRIICFFVGGRSQGGGEFVVKAAALTLKHSGNPCGEKIAEISALGISKTWHLPSKQSQ